MIANKRCQENSDCCGPRCNVSGAAVAHRFLFFVFHGFTELRPPAAKKDFIVAPFPSVQLVVASTSLTTLCRSQVT